jgi:hypothetical protein
MRDEDEVVDTGENRPATPPKTLFLLDVTLDDSPVVRNQPASQVGLSDKNKDNT